VEEFLTEHGITVTYETIRQWHQKFESAYARKLKRRQGRLGNMWHLAKAFITTQEELQYLWRAVDQDGNDIDILVQCCRNQRAAERIFRTLLKCQGREPRWLVTHTLHSYNVTHCTMMPTMNHLNKIYTNNQAEASHQPTRQQDRAMRGFKALTQTQRFRTLHGLTQNLFRLSRHPSQAVNYRLLRTQAFQVGQEVECA
jgi:putative transposase